MRAIPLRSLQQRLARTGIAEFPNLQLGLYVVVETGTPDKVTSPVKPFLVSVPMTRVNNPNEWLYDIHVYPKNGTTYGEVKIVKYGRVGSDTVGTLQWCKLYAGKVG